MRIIAIDPGTEKSAMLIYTVETAVPWRCKIVSNEQVLREITGIADMLAIEIIESFGMPVGRETFDTVLWTGRFIQKWCDKGFAESSVCHLSRRAVKMHLCHSMQAKDSNVRQVLIDRFGPGKEKAVGTKKSPGPLYGIKKDIWSALAVAVTAADGIAKEKQQ
ncbi:MAG: hypothetical protein V2A79_10200 [Planctomycetota bacterium]